MKPQPAISSFWQQLNRPIIGLSPMDGVSDYPFRAIQKKYGQPDVMYTEFTSVEGMCHGADRLLWDFLFDEAQRPIIAQIYGTTPEFFQESAVILCELGFDGIDINMGCPAKNVAHSGAGAALIKNPHLAQSIFRSTQAGVSEYQNGKRARDCAHITPDIWQIVEKRHKQLPVQYQQPRHIPVSVKTRIGYETPVIADWIPTLLELEPTAIAVHGRTLNQHYGGTANWDAIGQAAELARPTTTLILGNGDITSRTDAIKQVQDYQLDGALIGRATMGNPWIFNGTIPDFSSSIKVAIEHAQLYEATFTQLPKYYFLPMRKHLGWYIRGVPNASQIRIELVKTSSAQEVADILQRYNNDILPLVSN